MNTKLSALLTTAVITGLLASQTVHAEEAGGAKQGDQVAADKNGCKGQKAADKNACKGMKDKKKKDKNSCKNGCGEAKEKQEESK